MTRIYGYLTSEAESEYRSALAGHAALLAGSRKPLEPAIARCLAPRTAVREGLHVGIAGRPIFQGTPVTQGSDGEIVRKLADRYRDRGIGFLDDLEGAFSIVVIEPASNTALLAIDRLGVERLAYSARRELLVFGDSAADIAATPGLEAGLRHQALYDFLFMHMVPAPQTIYEGIYKLPPATALIYEAGRTHRERYWAPRYEYARRAELPELKADLRNALRHAVEDCGIDAKTGAFLSGGLDSSSVAGTLAELSSIPANTFTIGFGEADYDELRFARIANQHFGCRAFEFQMSPADIVEAFPKIAATYDEPFGNSSAAPTYFCAKAAFDNGFTHLLAGDGGDELFGGNERYIRHGLFEIYDRLPLWLRHAAIDPVVKFFPGESGFPPLRKVRSYVDQAKIPLPERFESWNFMYREGGAGMLDPEFSATVDKDGPMQLMRKVWQSAPSENLLERMLWYDWHFTLADNDLRKVGAMCELAGVRVSYPMLHPAVVGLSLRVPPSAKIRGLELRSFFKSAMKDFLPDEIIRKKKHGFGLPFGLWLKSDRRLADLIYGHLQDLKKRRIINARFIDDLIDQHRAGHASYFGYAIWDLAMLQAWLAHHIDGTTSSQSG